MTVCCANMTTSLLKALLSSKNIFNTFTAHVAFLGVRLTKYTSQETQEFVVRQLKTVPVADLRKWTRKYGRKRHKSDSFHEITQSTMTSR